MLAHMQQHKKDVIQDTEARTFLAADFPRAPPRHKVVFVLFKSWFQWRIRNRASYASGWAYSRPGRYRRTARRSTSSRVYATGFISPRANRAAWSAWWGELSFALWP